MPAKPTTVAQYLNSLPPDRRAALSAVRKVIKDNLDPAYVECVQYGMIGYAVPHSVYPAGYHCDPKQPLPFAALGSNKSSMSLHLMGIYFSAAQRAWFERAWARTGQKLDLGQACVRMKSLDDVPLEVIGEAIRRVPARQFIADYEAALSAIKSRKTKGPPGKLAAKAKPRSRAARG
jgi:hypothetical protein